MSKDSTVYEPPPEQSEGDVWIEVIEDMKARRKMGIEKYGTPLQPDNGRNALVDAYQEILDAAVYLKQKIVENQLSQDEMLEVEFNLSRYCVSVTIEDNATGEILINEGFNTPTLEYVKASLKEVIEKL